MNYNVDEYTEPELIRLMDLDKPTDGELEAKILFFITKYEHDSKYKQFFEDIYSRFFETIEGFAMEAVGPVQSTSYTKLMDYTVSATNPLLKETTQRIISVDSQFRDKTLYRNSTDYTFNLSESLNNVVSLKLYSIQIPYTWYTINGAYGSNFFFIKGNSPGINDGAHDYKIMISSGSYSAANLVSVIQTELSSVILANPDVNFGRTEIGFNQYSTKATITMDITNIYNESNYYLDWNTSIPSRDPYDRLSDIPSYLGYYYGTGSHYIPYSFNSSLFLTASTGPVIIDTSFSIITRQNENIIDQFSITISGTYTPDQLLTRINLLISTNSRFKSPSGITGPLRSTLLDINDNPQYYYNMIISLNRLTNVNTTGLTTSVRFDTITAAVFGFKTDNAINTVISENTNVITTYNVMNSSINLKCNKSGYINGNDITVTVLPNSAYLLPAYLAAIRTALNIPYLTGSTITNSPKIGLTFKVNKVFDQNMYNYDMSSNIMHTLLKFYASYSYTEVAIALTSTFLVDSQYITNSNPIEINPPNVFGNRYSPGYTVRFPAGTWTSITQLQQIINATFANTDISGHTRGVDYGTCIGKSLTPSSITSDLSLTNVRLVQNGDHINCVFNVKIHNALTNEDYTAYFIDPGAWTQSTWHKYLYLPNESTAIINTVDGTQSVLANNINISSNNNIFYLKPLPNASGVYAPSNNIKFTVPNDTYTKETLMAKINTLFQANPLTVGSYIESVPGTPTIYTDQYTQIRLNINKIYTAADYNIVFYDVYSFVYCNVGVTGTSLQNITQDSTLGWILGFRSNTIYKLADIAQNPGNYVSNQPENNSPRIFNASTKIVNLRGDTSVNVNLYNYFLIILDDYSLNKLNDGLITLTPKESTIYHPSYSAPVTYICDPVTGQETATTANVGQNATQNQIYSSNAILQAQLPTPQLYSHGPNVADMFGLIPIKTAGLANGQVYVDFGGTLQNQSRNYFGPTNIQRMTIRLMNDRGSMVDLNNSDWSFSLLCDQLYTPPK